MSMEEKTVEYCFDSNIYSGEDIKRKIEELKKGFSKISNKPVEVRVEINEAGIYVLTFKFYAKRKITKLSNEKINRVYIESLGEYSNGYINKLIGKKDNEYINKLKDRSKEQKELKKRLKQQEKQNNYAKIEYVKKEKTKNKKEAKPQKFNQYSEKKRNRDEKQENVRTPHIEYLQREEEDKKLKEILNEYLQVLKNVKVPKLERKNKVKVKNKVEKIKTQYKQQKENSKTKKYNQIGEKHYWSENYIPKEYGKYKETKKYKPL